MGTVGCIESSYRLQSTRLTKLFYQSILVWLIGYAEVLGLMADSYPVPWWIRDRAEKTYLKHERSNYKLLAGRIVSTHSTATVHPRRFPSYEVLLAGPSTASLHVPSLKDFSIPSLLLIDDRHPLRCWAPGSLSVPPCCLFWLHGILNISPLSCDPAWLLSPEALNRVLLCSLCWPLSSLGFWSLWCCLWEPHNGLVLFRPPIAHSLVPRSTIIISPVRSFDAI